LSSIGSSPFADLQTAPCWVEISHDGHYLFTVNTASNSISRYAIADAGSLSLLGSTAISDELDYSEPGTANAFQYTANVSGTAGRASVKVKRSSVS